MARLLVLKYMQQEAIWHIFLFCNICDKKWYGVTFVFSVKNSQQTWNLFLFLNICNKDQYNIIQNFPLLMYKLHIMAALNCWCKLEIKK